MMMLRGCCCPIYAEMLRPRVVALVIAVTGAAQIGASCFGMGMPCAFHWMTGIPCPGCGLTRSILALLQGRLKDSVLLHPFGPLLFLALAAALAAAVMPRILRERLIRAIAAVETRTGITVWLGVMLFVIWGIRLSGISPLRPV
jgi:Protein of unknown function (DUF2752)